MEKHMDEAVKEEPTPTHAQLYAQALYERYGTSMDLASERLHKYIPMNVDGSINEAEIDSICRSTELGSQLVGLLRGTTDVVGEELLTSYAVDLMFYKYVRLVESEES